MVLGLLHDQATYMKGLGYLIFYNLIFVAPLVIILFIAGDKKILGKVQTWQQKEKGAMRLWSGAIMIALGLITFLF